MLCPWFYEVCTKTWNQIGLLARKEPGSYQVKHYFRFPNIFKITHRNLRKFSVTTQNSYLNSLKAQKDGVIFDGYDNELPILFLTLMIFSFQQFFCRESKLNDQSYEQHLQLSYSSFLMTKIITYTRKNLCQKKYLDLLHIFLLLVINFTFLVFAEFKVARVVNLKSVFTNLFLYKLLILIKLCKIRYLN